MKIVPATYELIEESRCIKKIEMAARTCYKSEKKITEDSAMKMFRKLVENKHTAMLEHADICMIVSQDIYEFFNRKITDLKQDCYKEKTPGRCYLRLSTFLVDTGERIFDDTEVTEPYRYVISGNVRAWIETFNCLEEIDETPIDVWNAIERYINEGACTYTFGENHVINVMNDLSCLSAQERMLHETFTVKFTVDRGITHELVRMRECSFAQESTRYCNYSQGKFGNELTFIKPSFFKENTPAYDVWFNTCKTIESQYMALVNGGVAPQEARSILPNSIKSDIVITANLMEWRWLFKTRACDMTGKAHPQMKEVTIPLLNQMRIKYPFAFGDLVPAYSYELKQS